jgi:hypothetical protein
MAKPSRSEARLLTRALRQGWNIPADKRSEVINVLCEIAGDKTSTKREKTSAARALMQASRVELDAIRVAQGAQYEDLVRRMAALEREGGGDGELAKAANGD